MSRDPFADAEYVDDDLYLAALDRASSEEERAFRDVLTFHRDVLNGGFSQAIHNGRDELAQYVQAFKIIGAGPLGDLIKLASDLSSEEQLTAITDAYVASTYNLAYVCGGNREDDEFPLQGDQVERLALRYARANRLCFESVREALIVARS